MASTNLIKIIEVCRVAPPIDSPDSTTELSLPLTFYDIFLLKFHPVKIIFFYKLTESTPTFFNSVILPKLKHSLSLTLLHFLPLAGNLTWPPHAAKPIILYTPKDGVSVTVAESNADFDHLSGNKPRGAAESHFYVPELSTSDTSASILSLQITLFPNKGFCIGYAMNHAGLDGKSMFMFLKAWAHICKHSEKEENPSLLPELITPFFDRTVVQDPDGLDMKYLNNWLEMKWLSSDSNHPRSLKLSPAMGPPPNLLRAGFEFSLEDIKKLRERVLSQWDKVSEERTNQTKPIHLSSFVLTYAYTLACMAKAKGLESNSKVRFGFGADCRARLDPPIHDNYFGNCVLPYDAVIEAGDLMGESGVALAAKRLIDLIKSLEKGVLDEAKEKLPNYAPKESGAEVIWLVSSNGLEFYGLDFGWGRPNKVEFTTIDRVGAFSMTTRKDGSGVEVGAVLKKQEMEIFDSLFVNGLKVVKVIARL